MGEYFKQNTRHCKGNDKNDKANDKENDLNIISKCTKWWKKVTKKIITNDKDKRRWQNTDKTKYNKIVKDMFKMIRKWQRIWQKW